MSISGLVDGDITATESAVIGSESRVTGDIATAELEMSKGAMVNGGLKMEKPKKPVVEEPQPEVPAEKEEPEFSAEEESSVFPLAVIEPISDDKEEDPADSIL